MPFIAAPVADATEDELVPEAEYDLTIESCEEQESKKSGKPMLMCLITIDNPPANITTPAPIFHYVSLPDPDDEPKTSRFKLRMIRRLLNTFNVAFEDNGFDSDDLVGAKGTCLVTQQEQQKEDSSGRMAGTGEYSHSLRLPKFANEVDEEEGEGDKKQTRRQSRSRG